MTDRLIEWDPKMLREKLCAARAPDAITHAAINNLIAIIDLHRPIGPDGKHGDLHTPTCGCEDKPLPLTMLRVEIADKIGLRLADAQIEFNGSGDHFYRGMVLAYEQAEQIVRGEQ